MMADSFSFRCGRFTRADIHVPIDLLRVRVNDFCGYLRGKPERDFALAHGGRTQNDNQFGFGRFCNHVNDRL
jgi:hypothetical protein